MYRFEEHAMNSFQSVVVPSSSASTDKKESSDICTTDSPTPKWDSENVKIVLRSQGEPLPQLFAREPKPPFVVALAYHDRSDTFLLFAFSSRIFPCRLERFERSGATINNVSQGLNESFLWNEVDAAALAAAADVCHRCGYFNHKENPVGGRGNGEVQTDNSNDVVLENESVGDIDSTFLLDKYDRAEHLRLVPFEEMEDSDDVAEMEVQSIKSLISNEILGINDMIMKHPDPNFLVPLSKSLSKTLLAWRSMCSSLPDLLDLPEVVRTMPLEFYEDADRSHEDRGHGMFEARTKERVDFDKISNTRKEQLDGCVKLCCSSLSTMKSLLHEVIISNDDFNSISPLLTFELARECMGSIASLEYQQKEGRSVWSQDCHEALEFGYLDAKIEEDSIILKPWLKRCEFGEDEVSSNKSETGSSSNHHSDGINDVRENEEVDESNLRLNSVDGAAGMVIRTWYHDDQALMQAFHSITSKVEKAIQHSNLGALKAVYDGIEGVKEEIVLIEKDSREKTSVNAARLVKLWNDEHFDFEGQERGVWEREGAWPRWTGDQADAFTSFGYDMAQEAESAEPAFAIDHAQLISSLRSLINELFVSGSVQGSAFLRTWKEEVMPVLNRLLHCAEKFLVDGDLLNASLLITSFSRVLCNPESAGKIAENFYGVKAQEIIMETFQGAMKMLSGVDARISLRFIDELTKGNHHVKRGAHWFYNILRSGITYFPLYRPSKIPWNISDQPSWFVNMHIASSIFINGGWSHPILSSALEGDQSSIEQWSTKEHPIILSERFSMMKLENMPYAISLAQMMHGDDSAMQFLVQNGYINEAIAQASSSRNSKGLAQLASDLIDSNPNASLLCAQASVLSSVEQANIEESSKDTQKASIDLITNLFVRKWIDSSDAGEERQPKVGDSSGHDGWHKVPSLHLFCTIAMCHNFFHAAKSTALMQSLIDDMIFDKSGISIAAAAIAVAARANSKHGSLHDALKYFVQKSGILSIRESYGGDAAYSGLLTQSAEKTSKCPRKMMDICCSLYQCSRSIMNEEKSRESAYDISLFEISLFSAVKIALLSGYEYFALDVIQSIRECNSKTIRCRHTYTPWNCLLACYSLLFESLEGKCDLIAEMLLSTYLKYPSSESVHHNEDDERARIWAVVALAKREENLYDLGAIACDHALSQHKENGRYGGKLNYIETLRQLHVIDSDTGSRDVPLPEHHTMEKFSLSQREKISKEDRNKLCVAYILQLFKRKSLMKPSAIAECIHIHKCINPSFWQLEADEVQQRLSSDENIGLCLSERKNLKLTTTVLYFVDHSIHHGETWSSVYFILAYGLRWLRSALGSLDMVQFNHSEELNGYYYQNFSKDWRTLFEDEDWDYNNEAPHHGFFRCHDMQCRPKFAALALVTVIKENVKVVKHNVSFLENVCQESLGLCNALECILWPTTEKFNNHVKFHSQLSHVFPSHLEPRAFAKTMLQHDWCRQPSLGFELNDVQKEGVPFLISRVSFALSYGMLEEASSLCILACETEDFMNDKIENESDSLQESESRCDVLQAFLLTLKNASQLNRVLPSAFINMVYHLTLSMNWFCCCHNCAPNSPTLSDFGRKFVPNDENLKMLHSAASSMEDGVRRVCTEIQFGTEFSYCEKMVCCLSRCCHWFYESCLSHGCPFSHLGRGDYSHFMYHETPEKDSKRKRKRESDCEAESDFKELQTYIDTRVHARDIKDWCRDALHNIKKGFEEQAAARLASKDEWDDDDDDDDEDDEDDEDDNHPMMFNYYG